MDGVPVGRLLPPADDRAAGSANRPPAGSCIVVVVTDAAVDSPTCVRLARRAGLGLARTGSIASHGSGEIFIGMATGLRGPWTDARGDGVIPSEARPVGPTGWDVDPRFAAVVEAADEAVFNSMLAAPTVTGRDGNTSYGLPAEQVRELLRAAGRC